MNAGTVVPLNHPLQWDFPLYTIQLGVPPWNPPRGPAICTAPPGRGRRFALCKRGTDLGADAQDPQGAEKLLARWGVDDHPL